MKNDFDRMPYLNFVNTCIPFKFMAKVWKILPTPMVIMEKPMTLNQEILLVVFLLLFSISLKFKIKLET